MSNTIVAGADDNDNGEQLDPAVVLDERARAVLAALQKAEHRRPPAERSSDAALWKMARKEAAVQLRNERWRARAGAVTRAAGASMRAEAASCWQLNRRQAAPWVLAAPYAVVGTAANLVATHNAAAVPAGVAAVVGAVAATGSWAAWRAKMSQRVPAKFTAKAQASMGLLCAWAAGMPLVAGPAVAGMWLALVAGIAWMGLSWWRHNEHPIPAVLPDKPAPRQVTDGAGRAFADRLVADWEAYVAGMGTLPESRLTRPREVKQGWAFSLVLVRGKQKLADARAAIPSIAAALNLDGQAVTIDADPRPGASQTTVVLTVVTTAPSTIYDGPRIVRAGRDVAIEIGPYADGDGSERFVVLTDQLTDAELAAGKRPAGSMNGGFALGTKGSGKSRLIEAVAVGLRALGVETWYLDPQGGKSSPALIEHADWPLAGVHGTDGPYSNVVALWKAIRAVCEVREAEAAASGEQGFQHTLERPAIEVIIDECHAVFAMDNPETGNSFGQDFAELDRIMRKNGVGLFGASQAITQDTFGRGNTAAVLRDGMCAVNVFLLAYGGKNLRLAPGYDDQACGSLPMNRGLGFNPRGERPHMRFQTRVLDADGTVADFGPWLAKYPRPTLDERVQKRIGAAYADRFTTHAENVAGRKAWLDQLDAAADGAALPAFGQAPTDRRDTPPPEVTLLSPRQRRDALTSNDTTDNDTNRNASNFDSNSASDSASDSASSDASVLTGTEERVVEVLASEPHTPTSLGRALGMSSQVAGRHLRNIAAKGHAVRNDDGSYSPA